MSINIFIFIFCILFLQSNCFDEHTYDFIVVGGGTSGSVISSRLSSKYRVLLIEAGSNQTNDPYVEQLDQFMNLVNTDKCWNIHKFNDHSVSHSNTEITVLRIIGGGSSGNAGAYERGHIKDWDDMATHVLDDSWKSENLDIYYQMIEKSVGMNNDLHKKGVVTLDFGKESLLSNSWIQTAKSFNIPYFNSFTSSSYGFAFEPRAIKDGKRQSTATTYIKNIATENLTVLYSSQVTKLLIESKNNKTSVIGVEAYSNGSFHHFFAKKEVILSAGSIYSPFILLHSGIGCDKFSPKNHTCLSGVGKNLFDNPSLEMIFSNNITSHNQTNDVIPVAMLRTNETGIEDTFIVVKTEMGKFRVLIIGGNYSTRGNISLYDSNPFSMPKIQFNLLENQKEIEIFKKRVNLVRKIMKSEPMSIFNITEISPRSEDIDTYIRKNLYHSSHFTGTCRMGPIENDDSVVDNNFRVIGVSNLRVVDTSIIPVQTRMGTVGSAILLAEKASKVIFQAYDVTN